MSSHGSTPPFFDPPVDDPSRRRLPPLLRRSWYSLNQAFRRRIAHLQITPDQFTVLRWLVEEEGNSGMTQRRLADLMASDPNTVTSVLNRMELASLIERRPHDTDRRAKLVQIKPKGRRVYDQARQVAVDLQTQIMSVIPRAKRQAFLENLEKIADAARVACDIEEAKMDGSIEQAEP